MKVLYIAGLAKSGSTYTARVLNQHSKFFSAGELEDLHEQYSDNFYSCSCNYNSGGHFKESCEYWSELIGLLLDEINLEKTARLTLKRTKEWRKALYQEKFSRVDQKFEQGNRLLFKRISEYTDSSIIIDCSKSPWRLIPLKEVFGDDLHILHLLRSPENELTSKVNREYNFYHTAFLKYIRRNLLYSLKFGSSPNYHRLRFEELIEEPGKQLSKLFDWLDVEFQDPFRKEQQELHHLCGSNARHPQKLPEPDPDRVHKDEINWTWMQKSVLKLLRTLY